MKKCPVCLSENFIKKTNESLAIKYKTSNGLKNVIVKGLSYSICGSCGEIVYSPDELEIYDRQLEFALEAERRNEGLLTAKQIKSIREKYHLTQVQLEKILSVGPKNVAKWETYRSNQSKIVDKILRLVYEDPSFFVKLLSQAGISLNNEIDSSSLKDIQRAIIFDYFKTLCPNIPEMSLSNNIIEKFNNNTMEILPRFC